MPLHESLLSFSLKLDVFNEDVYELLSSDSESEVYLSLSSSSWDSSDGSEWRESDDQSTNLF